VRVVWVLLVLLLLYRILCRECLLKHVIDEKLEGDIKVMGRRERRSKQDWITFRKSEDIVN
jgi:hypothetical protein